MQAQRSIMKNRALPSNNRNVRLKTFPAAAMAVTCTVMAAALLGSPHRVSAAGVTFNTASENTSDAESLQSESSDPEKNGRGMLILEDPKEKTRYAEYEMAVGDSFSISFIHSVNKSPVIDYFEIRGDGIYGVKTVYYNFGAGVPSELEEGQTLTYGDDGSMILTGFNIRMNSLIYRVGTVSDHILTLEDGSEISLRDLCGRSARVGFRFEAAEEADEETEYGSA